MSNAYTHFADRATRALLAREAQLAANASSQHSVQVTKPDGSVAVMNLTPFAARTTVPTAAPFFAGVATVPQLLSAYQQARSSVRFEADLPAAMTTVSAYAAAFVDTIFARARVWLSDSQATLIARWVSTLDSYCAVKAVESLLYSRADLALLEIAPTHGWSIHFDHLAIRCGTRAHQDAERVRDLLVNDHGYVASQLPSEAFYQFPDGWNAYPVYKMLDNGQALRVFIDQSDAEDSKQIIQHWNTVYGYTAHHLAMRATTLRDGIRSAVPLDDVMRALNDFGIDIMTATGQYTGGLLLQVFTRPEKNSNVPTDLRQQLGQIDATLPSTLENAKLLEVVSRRELPLELARELYALYGLRFDPNNPLHSAPVYQYFLPEQAAHVIRTSQQVQ